MSAPLAFDYTIVQVVPRVDRDERVNAGVILFCPAAAFLGCRIALDAPHAGLCDDPAAALERLFATTVQT